MSDPMQNPPRLKTERIVRTERSLLFTQLHVEQILREWAEEHHGIKNAVFDYDTDTFGINEIELRETSEISDLSE
jgi:hypothetical protein